MQLLGDKVGSLSSFLQSSPSCIATVDVAPANEGTDEVKLKGTSSSDTCKSEQDGKAKQHVMTTKSVTKGEKKSEQKNGSWPAAAVAIKCSECHKLN